jgi:hypothetical protein
VGRREARRVYRRSERAERGVSNLHLWPHSFVIFEVLRQVAAVPACTAVRV